MTRSRHMMIGIVRAVSVFGCLTVAVDDDDKEWLTI